MTHTPRLICAYADDINRLDFISNDYIRRCAGLLINVFRRAQKFFGEGGKWFYYSLRQIQNEMLGWFGKDTIRHALLALMEAGIVRRKAQTGQVFLYKLNPNYLEVREDIPTLAEPDEEDDDWGLPVTEVSDDEPVASMDIVESVQPVPVAPIVQPIVNAFPPRDATKEAFEQRSQLPEWRTKWGVNGYKEEFVAYIQQWLRKSTDKPFNRADAIAYIAKRENQRSPHFDLDTLVARCAEWREDQDKRAKNDAIRAGVVTDQPATTTVVAPIANTAAAAAYQAFIPEAAPVPVERTPREICEAKLALRKAAKRPLDQELRKQADEFGLDISFWVNGMAEPMTVTEQSEPIAQPKYSNPKVQETAQWLEGLPERPKSTFAGLGDLLQGIGEALRPRKEFDGLVEIPELPDLDSIDMSTLLLEPSDGY